MSKLQYYSENKKADILNEKSLYPSCDSLSHLKSLISTDDYPFTVIETIDTEDSMTEAIRFAQNMIKLSQKRPTKLLFQNILFSST